MREILVIQLGGFGNKVGVKFWEEMLKDSDFGNQNEQGLQSQDPLLNSINNNKPLPRCVQVDLGQDLPCTNIDFNPCSQFSFNYSSGNNYGFVKNHCANEIMDIIVDSIRQETEKCDQLQGIQLFSSIIGGTGSGLIAALDDKLGYDPLLQYNLLIPSIKQDDVCVVSPYNSILALSQIMNQREQIVCFDNQGLKQNLSRLGIEFNYDDANHHIAQTICCNSSPFRNNGDINSSLKKLSANLIPFPQQNFLTCSQSNNQFSDYFKEYLKMDETQIFRELMSTNHNQASNDYTQGRFLTAALSLRGNISNKEVDKSCSLFQHYLDKQTYYRRQEAKKIKYIDMFLTNICKKPFQNFEYFGSCLINSTSITQSLESLIEKFNKMYVRKSYLYKYTQEGIDEDNFIDAKTRLEEICDSYKNTYQEDFGEGHENWE
uniref:Tubulin beta chain n=1 Tax=Paramecium tetraurelia TaxID=5888 RepID=Q3SEG2_PARTE|nr:beta tubulin,putative [Paramecium tetraurelia]